MTKKVMAETQHDSERLSGLKLAEDKLRSETRRAGFPMRSTGFMLHDPTRVVLNFWNIAHVEEFLYKVGYPELPFADDWEVSACSDEAWVAIPFPDIAIVIERLGRLS